MMKKISAIFLASILLLLISVSPVLAATNHDLSSTSQWDVRFDGAVAGDSLTEEGVVSGDLNNNGITDLLIGVQAAGNNSRSFSGSVYVIYDTTIDDFTSLGGTADLSTSTRYNVRFDGAAAIDLLGSDINIADVDGDSKNDLLLGANSADNNVRNTSGSIYVIYNTLLDDFTGTGNNVDLNSGANYNLRFDGAAANDRMGSGRMLTGNLNATSAPDLVIVAGTATRNTRSGSGAMYVIYDSIISTYTGTGNNIDLNTSSNYNLQYAGAAASQGLGRYGLAIYDIDSDGSNDLAIGTTTSSFNSRADSGSMYIVYNSLIDDYAGTGNNIDLNNSSNYNIRYDGAAAGDLLSNGGLAFADLDAIGKPDMFISAGGAGNNSRVGSGSIYLVYGSLIDDYAGTGNNVDLNTSANYNLRYDGAAAADTFGRFSRGPLDFNNNGKPDLYIDASGADNNSRASSGSLYIIYDNLIDDYAGTGNNIDIANTSNYSVRWDGASAGDSIGVFFASTYGDYNGDGALDVAMGGGGADYNSRANSGSLWTIFNFPHSVNVTNPGSTNDSTPSFSGSITVSALSPTSLSGVQFSINNNNPNATWTGCSVNGTNYTCQVTSDLANGNYTVFVRAYDGNFSYTPQSRYGTFTLNIAPGGGGGSGGGSGSGGGGSSGGGNGNLPGYQLPVSVGPHHSGALGNGGLFYCSGDGFGSGAILTNDLSTNDLYFNPLVKTAQDLQQAKIPLPWQKGFNIYSQICDFTAKSSFNAYPIYTADKAYTIIMGYDPAKLGKLNPKSLKITYWDAIALKWKTLPGPYVVNQLKRTIAAATKVFSLFAAATGGGVSVSNSQGGKNVVAPVVNSQPTEAVPVIQETKFAPQPAPPPAPKSTKTCFFGICW